MGRLYLAAALEGDLGHGRNNRNGAVYDSSDPADHRSGAPVSEALKILLDTPPSPYSMHRLDDWMRCRRYYAFRHIAKETNPGNKAQSRGSTVHIVLSHAGARAREEREGRNPNRYYTPEEAIEQVIEKRREEMGEVNIPNARAVALRVVKDIVPELRVRFRTVERVLTVEEPFQFDIRGPATGRVWRYQQRPDLTSDDGGGVSITEYKSTTVAAKGTTFTRYSHTFQFTAYRWWGPKMWPNRFRGALIGVVDIAEGMEEDATGKKVLKRAVIKREKIEPAPKLVAGFEWLAERAELEIERALQEWGTDPFAYTPSLNEQVCITSYGRCPYWELCSWGERATVQRGAGSGIRFSVEEGVDG